MDGHLLFPTPIVITAAARRGFLGIAQAIVTISYFVIRLQADLGRFNRLWLMLADVKLRCSLGLRAMVYDELAKLHSKKGHQRHINQTKFWKLAVAFLSFRLGSMAFSADGLPAGAQRSFAALIPAAESIA